MLEFKVLQELKPNSELLGVIKNYTYKTKNGKVKHLLHTNLQICNLTEETIRRYYILVSVILLFNEETNEKLKKLKFTLHFLYFSEETSEEMIILWM